VLDGVAEDLRHLREHVDVHFQRGGHLLKGVLRYRRHEPGGSADGGDEEKSGELCSGDHFGRPGAVALQDWSTGHLDLNARGKTEAR